MLRMIVVIYERNKKLRKSEKNGAETSLALRQYTTVSIKNLNLQPLNELST